jgi:siroheme synthase-like protein
VVVAPKALAQIEELAQTHKVQWFRRPYRSSDLASAYLVIAATDDPKLQKRVAKEARARRIWVNVVDVTPLCDFLAPAIVSRGDLLIAISTGGASPALARFVRQKLEAIIGPEYGDFVELLRRYRPKILKLPQAKRQGIWEAIITQPFLDRLKGEGIQSAEDRLKEMIYGTASL